jgi:hypothetical protein
MKKLLTILLTIIALQANAQFKYNDGKATANMDTLGMRNDTLFLRNRVTGEISYMIVENGETFTTREKVAVQINDSNQNKLNRIDTINLVSTKSDDAELNAKISALSDIQVVQKYYLDATPSDIGIYSKLIAEPLIFTGVDSTVNLDNNEVLIASFITNSGKPNVDTISAGQWLVRFLGQFSSNTGDNYFHIDLYKRNLVGTETFLFRISTNDIAVATIEEYTLQEIEMAIQINTDDRLVVKIYAQTTGGAKTATLHYSNSKYFAYVQPPLTFSIPESDPVYSTDSSYIKANIRRLLIKTDTCKLNVNASMSNIISNYYTNATLYAFCNTDDVAYEWSGPGSYSQFDKTVSASLAGLYRVIVTKSGCDADTAEIYVPGIFANGGTHWDVDTLVTDTVNNIATKYDLTQVSGSGITLPDSFSISRRGVAFDSIIGIKLDRSETWYFNDTIRDTLRIHVDTSQIGGAANITFVADSTYTPTIDILSRDATPIPIEQDPNSDPYDNTQGHRNEFFIYRNGDRIWWSWTNKD